MFLGFQHTLDKDRAYLGVRRVRRPWRVAQGVRASSVGQVAGLSCHPACQPPKGTG